MIVGRVHHIHHSPYLGCGPRERVHRVILHHSHLPHADIHYVQYIILPGLGQGTIYTPTSRDLVHEEERRACIPQHGHPEPLQDGFQGERKQRRDHEDLGWIAQSGHGDFVKSVDSLQASVPLEESVFGEGDAVHGEGRREAGVPDGEAAVVPSDHSHVQGICEATAQDVYLKCGVKLSKSVVYGVSRKNLQI